MPCFYGPGRSWWAFLYRPMICDVKTHPSGSHNQSPYCQRTLLSCLTAQSSGGIGTGICYRTFFLHQPFLSSPRLQRTSFVLLDSTKFRGYRYGNLLPHFFEWHIEPLAERGRLFACVLIVHYIWITKARDTYGKYLLQGMLVANTGCYGKIWRWRIQEWRRLSS